MVTDENRRIWSRNRSRIRTKMSWIRNTALVLKHTIQLRFWKFWIHPSKSPGFERIRFRIPAFKYVPGILYLAPLQKRAENLLNLSPIQGLCVLCGGLPLRGADTAGTGGSRRRTATSDGLLRGTVSSFPFLLSRHLLANRNFFMGIQQFWLLHVANPPNSVAKTVGRLWSDVRDEVWFGSIFQRLIVFWWFLQTYMRSGSFSCWIFLRIQSSFFWCILGPWAMANSL